MPPSHLDTGGTVSADATAMRMIWGGLTNYGGDMDRWSWMLLRAYAPTIVSLVLAIVVTTAIGRIDATPLLAALLSPAKWIVLAALGFAVAHGGWMTYRLWRADRGEGFICDCGGLLSPEIHGRYGPYRKCMACRRSLSRQHYKYMG